MDNTCVSCGAIIPEGSQVCINCMAKNCVQCSWDNPENCRACRNDEIEEKLKGLLASESQRIRGD
jgi:RNA polymerase subunit RPABC4/transcription elongation factor Spt4